MQELENIKINELKGIGEKKALAFKKLGVCSLYDLLYYFPKRYEDRTNFKQIAEISNGECTCVCVVVSDNPSLNRIRKGLDIVKFRAYDETGAVNVTFFNQSYVKNNIHKGDCLNLYGKFSIEGKNASVINPVYEDSHSKAKCGVIKPIYGLCAGLTQKNISDSVSGCISSKLHLIEDAVPQQLLDKYRLLTAEDAISKIHFPNSFDDIASSRKRMIFEELLVFCCALELMRGPVSRGDGILISRASCSSFIASLPFSPTNAQKRAIDDCLNDMRSGKPMRRLIQGDVGSGKTLVAAAAIYAVCQSGFCAAFMAPTEILAQQHYNTFSRFFSGCNYRIELLTGSTSSAKRQEILSALKSGKVQLVVGTHALFSSDVEYSNLALTVTDEQHRFGVKQRSALIEKGKLPHVLVMSATPIPRTLSLILYGDLDISVIDELPPGRLSVDTYLVNSSFHARIVNFIRKQVLNGNQVFVVCPKVEDDEEGKMKSALEYSRELDDELNGLHVSCIHGKMKNSEKDDIMSSFAADDVDVLVATTVIEVGVDVPNATVMIIENADRFGLSQLHQLRGRVGRGNNKSYCILVSDTESESAIERLKMLCSTNDGFKIAEYDLKTRGPGELLGARQHGLPELPDFDYSAEFDLFSSVKQEAHSLLDVDPCLNSSENRALKDKVDRFCKISTASLN